MGGSPLPFRGGKFSTNEGGVRVFCIAHWPRVLGDHVHKHHPFTHDTGQSDRSLIESGASGVFTSALTSTLDIAPTFVALAQVRSFYFFAFCFLHHYFACVS
jgi:arylsulfatase A-like enzyme